METVNIEQVSRASLKPKAEDIFRGLWASLFNSGPAERKGVVVCSANRQEGASTIACGLALAGSEPSSGRVALVELNLRAPSLGKVFRTDGGPGIGEVILDGLPAEQAARPINSAMDLYPVGQVGDRILDVLRSDALGEFLNKLTQSYGQVLVDVAAVNEFPDAAIVASRIPDVLLVVHADQTPREAVALAKKRLEGAGGKLAGVVLNMRSYPIPKFLYSRV